jgi:hypothetical protein
MQPSINEGLTQPIDAIVDERETASVQPCGRTADAAFDSALASACQRIGMSHFDGWKFILFLVRELVERAVRGEFIRIPRLVVMCVVPCPANKSFRLKCLADGAVRRRIRREVTGVSETVVDAFKVMCRTLVCSVPGYLRRGSTFARLMDSHRRRIDLKYGP